MIGKPPRIFKKNVIDLDQSNVTITVVDPVATDTGEAFADAVRDRRNSSGWSTTDSTDAALTLFQVMFGDEFEIDTIFLVRNNFKDYEIEWFDGSVWNSLVTVTNNTENTTFHEFPKITAEGIRVRINATIILDDDKFLSQLIPTEKLGDFNQFPLVVHEKSLNRKRLKMISGKSKIIQNSGSVEISVSHNNQIDDNDLNLVEIMFNSFSGFLFWASGGDESQFRTRREGFRREDIFLMAPRNEYSNPWGSDGKYKAGTNYKVELVEVV